MDLALHLALAAIVRGLRHGGLIDEDGVAMIVAEMHVAAEEAAALMHDHDAIHLRRLAHEIAIDGGCGLPIPPMRAAAATLRIG